MHGDVMPRQPARHPFLPTTRIGRWALALALLFFPLQLLWSLLPGGAALGFACGLAGGILGLTAIARRGERAISVFATLIPLALVVVFVVAEIVIGHD